MKTLDKGRTRPPDEPASPLPKRKTLGHEVPAWVESAAVYFITICAEPWAGTYLVSDGRADRLIQMARYLHETGKWHLRIFLVMPDHLHALVSVPASTRLVARVSAWKSYTTKNVGVIWQDGFFDHWLRSNESLDEKLEYIRMNPVRAGLVEVPNRWTCVFEPHRDACGSAGTPRPTN